MRMNVNLNLFSPKDIEFYTFHKKESCFVYYYIISNNTNYYYYSFSDPSERVLINKLIFDDTNTLSILNINHPNLYLRDMIKYLLNGSTIKIFKNNL